MCRPLKGDDPVLKNHCNCIASNWGAWLQSMNRYENDLGVKVTFVTPSFLFEHMQDFKPGKKDYIQHTEGGGWIVIKYKEKTCRVFVPAAINSPMGDPLPLSELLLRSIQREEREGHTSCLANLIYPVDILEGLKEAYYARRRQAMASCTWNRGDVSYYV